MDLRNQDFAFHSRQVIRIIIFRVEKLREQATAALSSKHETGYVMGWSGWSSDTFLMLFHPFCIRCICPSAPL